MTETQALPGAQTENTESRWRIQWRIRSNGQEGQGEPIYTYQQAQAWCDRLNSEWRGIIHHWPVSV